MAIEVFDDIEVKEVERKQGFRRLTKEKDGIVEYDENGKTTGTWYQFKDEKLAALMTCENGQLNGLQILFDDEEKPQFVAHAENVPFKAYRSKVRYSKVGSEDYPDYAADAHAELNALKKMDHFDEKLKEEDFLQSLEDVSSKEANTTDLKEYLGRCQNDSEKREAEEDFLEPLEDIPTKNDHADQLRTAQDTHEMLSVEVIDALKERIR